MPLARSADTREKCGEDFWLMLDCWMSQDVNYATKLAHACAPYTLNGLKSACRHSSMRLSRTETQRASRNDGHQR